jgi:hypothetical protein
MKPPLKSSGCSHSFSVASDGHRQKKLTRFLVIPEIIFRFRDLAPPNQPAPEPFTKPLPKHGERNIARSQEVENRPQSFCHAYSVDNFRVAFWNIIVVQNKDARNLAIPAKAHRYSHMEFCRHHVRNIVNAQGSLVAVDTLNDLSTVSRPKGPHH